MSDRLAEIFERLSRRLLEQHPEDERGRMLQSVGLKTSGKFFAFPTKGELVVKLPAPRVEELIASGAGQPCNPRGTGRSMREWVRLTPADEAASVAYVMEARDFVSGQAGNKGAGT